MKAFCSTDIPELGKTFVGIDTDIEYALLLICTPVSAQGLCSQS